MPKTKKITGTFDIPFGVPIIMHEVPDGEQVKIGIELIRPFETILERTPECNDFRQLNSSKEWVAYSTMLDKDGQAVRATGKTILEALMFLRDKMGYEA